MTPTGQVINLLKTEPENWVQESCTLDHKSGIRIWTASFPYLNCGLYKPKRKTSFIDRIRLQIAVNKWHKLPLILNENNN